MSDTPCQVPTPQYPGGGGTTMDCAYPTSTPLTLPPRVARTAPPPTVVRFQPSMLSTLTWYWPRSNPLNLYAPDARVIVPAATLPSPPTSRPFLPPSPPPKRPCRALALPASHTSPRLGSSTPAPC